MLDIEIKENIFLNEYLTFQLGGQCLGLFECKTPDQLCYVVKSLKNKNKRFIIIGEGSNLLVSDKGLDCFVIRYLSKNPDIIQDNHKVVVSASTLTDDLAFWAAQNGLSGLNFLSGIPGTLAGAITGNAGSFGQQISSVLSKVTLLKPDGTLVEESAQALGFSYRHSRIKESNEIVVRAELSGGIALPEELLDQRKKILALRRQKHPDYKIIPCAGSFFKNIDKPYSLEGKKAAGWFLEQVGAKAMTFGGAGVFERHANILIKKTSKCTAQDIYSLSCIMQQAVYERFGIKLEPEVRLIGEFDKKLNRLF